MNAQMNTLGPRFNVEAIRLGYFTIENTATGEHRTFRVRKQNKTAKFQPDAQIVGLLTGTDNEGDYTGFAFINQHGVHIWTRLSRKSTAWAQYGKALFSLLTLGNASPYVERGYIVRHSTRCFMCGRTLTTPDSIDNGIGPVCAGR